MVKILSKILNKSVDVFGNAMKKTSITFQFQSSLAAYGLLWLSVIFLFLFNLYSTIFHFSWWSLFYAINALCGIMIIYSMLVSTFMSYLQIKAAQEANKLFEAMAPMPEEESKEEVKEEIKDGN